MNLPLNNSIESYYTDSVSVGSFDATKLRLTVDNGTLRTNFPYGVYLGIVEGLSKVADSVTTYPLSDFGHFRLHYSYELREPIPKEENRISPAALAKATFSLSPDVLSLNHTILFSKNESGELVVDRSHLNPVLSPYGRVLETGKDLLIPIHLDRSGSNKAIVITEGSNVTHSGFTVIPMTDVGISIFEQSSNTAYLLLKNDISKEGAKITIRPVD